jgi:enterochelin esterase-like enzyme
MIAKSLQRELLLAIAGSLIINVAIGQQAVAVPAESVESAPTAFKNSLASEQTNKKFTALKTAAELSEAQSSEAQSSEAQSSEAQTEEAQSSEAQTEEVSDNAVSSEMSEITESDGTTVILPPGYDANQSYPALVLMPYTNRTALHMFNWGMYEAYHRRSENAFVVIMPPGQGSSANWSGAGWEAFVDEYEGYVQQDLNPLVAKYNIDPEQLVVGGFSLGGDLSWALSLRNPDIFSGAIVMGSMSTYRDEQNADQLAANRFRYFMVMGGYDGNWNAMQDALANLEQHAISYHYEEVGNAGHGDLPEQMERDLFLSAMDYVLEEQVAVRE